MTEAGGHPADWLRGAFKAAFAGHPSGVAVLSAEGPEGPVAMTVGSLISVADDPPTVALSLSARSSASGPILRAGTLVIHFPRRGDVQLARLCATPGADRFAAAAWTRLPTGEPKFVAATTWFRAVIVQRLPVRGATLIVAELTDGSVAEDHASPQLGMVYMNRRWHGLDPSAG